MTVLEACFIYSGLRDSLTREEKTAQAKDAEAAQYVGSQSCERCHKEAYLPVGSRRGMAEIVVLDPKVHPEAVLGDFTSSRSGSHVQTGSGGLYLHGSRWKQRYFFFTKAG